MKKIYLFVLLCASVQAADTVSISGLIEDYNRSIADKNKDVAIQSLTRLYMLVRADYKYFNTGQLDLLEKQFTEYSAEIADKLNIVDVQHYIQIKGACEASWLLNHIEQGKINIDWSMLVNGLNLQHSGEELKAHRIATLRALEQKYADN